MNWHETRVGGLYRISYPSTIRFRTGLKNNVLRGQPYPYVANGFSHDLFLPPGTILLVVEKREISCIAIVDDIVLCFETFNTLTFNLLTDQE